MMAASKDSDNNILRVLCIHGYRQNADAFKEKLGAFRKCIKKHAELIFIDAPLSIPSLDSNSASEKNNERGWWFSQQDQTFDAKDTEGVCLGLEESLETVKRTFKEQGPFDGLLGFSQGASLVSIICALIEKHEFPYSVNFAILVAGFKSQLNCHSFLYDGLITIPSLHVFGETDKVIPKEMSEELTLSFKSARTIVHSGGHYMPVNSQHKNNYIEFFQNVLENAVQNCK